MTDKYYKDKKPCSDLPSAVKAKLNKGIPLHKALAIGDGKGAKLKDGRNIRGK